MLPAHTLVSQFRAPLGPVGGVRMLRSSRRLYLGALAGVCLVVVGASVALRAQIPGRNVNMVAGTEWPGGDPFLQRQNEPSIAASTRNPLHLVAGSNDYRSVDVPGLPDGAETGDAWVSVYKSFDGGQRWSSTLMPGYPQDTSAEGVASPIKGYQAAADPVVRAGTHGLVYYNGLVFNRGDNGRSAIFLARFIDRNNKENGDPIAYLGTSIVASSDGTTFLDKPWMAVDMPRGAGAFCRVGLDPTAVVADDDDDDDHKRGGKVKRNGHRNRGHGRDRRRKNQPPDDGYQYVPAGAVYVAYTSITGDGPTLQSQIFVKRSMDCGVTWSAPMRVTSTADRINQGATLSVSPTTGDLFVAWRRFSTSTVPDTDAVMVARLRMNGGAFEAPGRAWGMRGTGPSDDVVEKIFEHRKRRANPTAAATVAQIDQSTGPYRFRTNAYPAMAIDGSGRAYIAWSERGYAALRNDPIAGDARIRVATTLDGRTFTAPVVVDDDPTRAGHQLMPSLAFSKGKLLVVFYDLRETRARAFGAFVDDQTTSTGLRQTIDIRASLGTPGATPAFAPSVQISDYLMGYRSRTATLEQLQVNPPNLPMFKLGTVPFIGDYIDVAASPAFVPTAGGAWVYNTATGLDMPVFHATWTDNRDVRPPLDGNWANYTPPTIDGQSRPSVFINDGVTQAAQCIAGNAGSRNQNIYTARIGGGLLVGSPGNTKPLSATVQRGFVVFAQNQTTTTRTFRMQVLAQPPQGRASFEQFPLPPYTAATPAPLTAIDVRVPAKSTASRTLYITAADPKAMVEVAVNEVTIVGGPVVNGGLAGRVVLNPDIENPDIENPDIENPDIENPDIENAEVYNPDIENPDIENPDIENPDIENPDIENPDIENVRVANPDIENPNVANPDIENPDIENPDIENPDIENPDIENGTISDVTWTVSNTGNTTSAFNVNLLLANAAPTCVAGQPCELRTQLIVYKTYKTPVLDPNGCDLRTETRNLLLFNKPNPNFITPGQGLPDQNDPSDSNATLWLAPGEIGRVTLRVYDDDTSNNLIVRNLDGSEASIDPAFNPKTVVTAGISGQGVDVLDPPGATEPPVVTTTGTNLTFLQQPLGSSPGAPISPAVRVRVWDNTGAVLPSVTVTMTLQNAPGATLSGNVAVTDAQGVATFPALAVDMAVTDAVLRAAATSPGVVAAGDSAPFSTASAWRAAGPGAVTLLDDGASGTPSFSYALNGNTGAWSLTKVATAAQTVPLTFRWTGFHSFFHVTTGLEAFVNRGGTDVTVVTLVNEPATGEGPVVCCAFPAGGFSYTGATALAVQPGDTFGFRVTGTHADAANQLNGTLNVVEGSSPYFTVTVRSTAGGLENQDPMFGPPTVPARVYGGTLVEGQQVTIAATGGVNRGFGPNVPPAGDGLPCPADCVAPGLSQLALLMRVGTDTWQVVGSGPTVFTAGSTGRLEFAVNDNGHTDNTGAFLATVVWGAASPVGLVVNNWAQIHDGTPKPVTVTTVPAGLPTLVTYNGSTTVPSAVGAYFVDATAAGPGLLWRTSVIETIASTVSGGGSGGGPYPASGALSCAPGVPATGLLASTNPEYGLTGVQLTCASGANPAPALATREVPSPTFAGASCAPGSVMVGVHGTTASPFDFEVVEQLGARCQSVGGPITDTGLVGGGFPSSQTFSLTCPAGQAVTGILGGAGEVIDSIALVCGSASLPAPAPAITSVVPGAQVAPGQMLTLNGTSLPGGSLNDVLFNQGAGDVPAQYMWGASATKATVRLPNLAVGVPTTVRVKNAGDTVSTAPFPITITNTPGTPVLHAVLNQCGPSGATITQVSPGGPLAIEGEGIDTSGTSIVFTPITAVGTVQTQAFLSSAGGPTGRVCSYAVTNTGTPLEPVFVPVGAPAGLTPGTWSVQIQTTVGGFPSALSNAIVITVPVLVGGN